jgi:tetratricopeptide (TPR) repeat protein
MSLNTLGMIFKEQNQLKQAAEALEESVGLAKDAKDFKQAATCLNTLGMIMRDSDNPMEAVRVLKESTEISNSRDHYHLRNLATAYSLLAGVYEHHLNDLQTALACLKKLYSIDRPQFKDKTLNRIRRLEEKIKSATNK